MMKFMVAIAMVISSSVAMADGAGWGTEEVIAAGGLTTVVGGCANPVIVGSGENVSVECSEPTAYAPTKPLTCEATQPSYVYVNGKWSFAGYVCPDYTDSNGN